MLYSVQYNIMQKYEKEYYSICTLQYMYLPPPLGKDFPCCPTHGIKCPSVSLEGGGGMLGFD